MSGPVLQRRAMHDRCGLKGPRAADWLTARGVELPPAPNTWVDSANGRGAPLLVMRLGSAEFFLEGAEAGTSLRAFEPAIDAKCGVYPVLREDLALTLSGEGSLEILAQVCNVNFAALEFESHPLIMTLMIGAAVLVLPQGAGDGALYRMWCDPTFGPYLEGSLKTVVVECGGIYIGVSA